MSLNLEIKVSYPALKRIYSKLDKLGAVNTDILKQTDIYYKIKNGLLKLRICGARQELIFYNRAEGAKKRWSEYYLLNLADDKPHSFLKRIFEEEVTVKKTRVLYMYKNTRIHLDTVSKLGTFIELESVVRSNRKEAEREFRLVKEALGLDAEIEIRKSYRDLLLQAGRK